MQRILVVASHPDDEILGCGGTLARLAAEGKEVHTLILGEGITSRADVQDATGALAALQADAQKAGDMVGAKSVTLLDFPDNRFDSVPLLEIVHAVEQVVDALVPDTVYTQFGGDLNVDHSATFRAVMTATRPMQGCSVRDVYAFEVASSTEWAFGTISRPFNPTVYVDVSATLDKKIKAMQAYESEARPFPHPRSPEALEALARMRGAEVGLLAAEAFELVRSIR